MFQRFLDILAARKDPSGLSGEVLIDGAPQPPNFKCLSGYVVQVHLIISPFNWFLTDGGYSGWHIQQTWSNIRFHVEFCLCYIDYNSFKIWSCASGQQFSASHVWNGINSEKHIWAGK